MRAARRLHYQGLIWRFRFLMMATLITAALTVIGFIIGQVSEGQYKWDEDISLEYTSGFMTGKMYYISVDNVRRQITFVIFSNINVIFFI